MKCYALGIHSVYELKGGFQVRKIVYITRTLPEEAIQPLQEQYDVRMWEHEDLAMTSAELKDAVRDVHALWTMIDDQITRDIMEAAPNLEIITNLAVGYNNIDIDAAKELGITVTNTPDVLSEATADLAFSLLLATARRITEAENVLREGKWKAWAPMQLTGMDIYGKTLGIIGMGRIGEAAARRALGFNMDVLYHNRTRKVEAEKAYGFTYAELENLLAKSDFVLLFAPLTDETRNLITKKEFALMKDTAILINVARGPIVNEDDLYDALKDGVIWGAGLDVYNVEPLPTNHKLLSLPNVTAIPHIGSATIQTRLAMMALNREAIIDRLEGRRPNNVLTN